MNAGRSPMQCTRISVLLHHSQAHSWSSILSTFIPDPFIPFLEHKCSCQVLIYANPNYPPLDHSLLCLVSHWVKESSVWKQVHLSNLPTDQHVSSTLVLSIIDSSAYPDIMRVFISTRFPLYSVFFFIFLGSPLNCLQFRS